MTSKEALKSLCNHCEKLSIRDGFIGCPFRNISNDYCEAVSYTHLRAHET